MKYIYLDFDKLVGKEMLCLMISTDFKKVGINSYVIGISF